MSFLWIYSPKFRIICLIQQEKKNNIELKYCSIHFKQSLNLLFDLIRKNEYDFEFSIKKAALKSAIIYSILKTSPASIMNKNKITIRKKN